MSRSFEVLLDFLMDICKQVLGECEWEKKHLSWNVSWSLCKAGFRRNDVMVIGSDGSRPPGLNRRRGGDYGFL